MMKWMISSSKLEDDESDEEPTGKAASGQASGKSASVSQKDTTSAERDPYPDVNIERSRTGLKDRNSIPMPKTFFSKIIIEIWI